MPIIPTQSSPKEHKLVPPGTHMARCYSILHIGHVPNTFPGAENPTIDKIRLTWELPEETAVFKEGEEPRPFSISAEYTLSMHEKSNLRKVVQSWLGRQFSDAEAANFDAEELVGEPCFINVVHGTSKDGRPFAYVENVMKLPAKTAMPEQVNTSKIINWDSMDEETFEKLPTFIQEKMKTSQEYARWKGGPALAKKPGPLDPIDYPKEDIDADEIPF